MTQTTHLYLVRHGQTEWNVENRLQGFHDSPLTGLGERQAMWLGDAFRDKPLDVIYSSSSRRASRTAELIRGDKPIAITQSDMLKEINLGVWEGLTQEEAKAAYPEAFEHFLKDPARFRVPGSESYDEVSQRAVTKVTEIIAAHPGEHILVVAHTVVVKLLMAHYEGRPLLDLWKPPYIHPVCLSHIEITADGPVIRLHADTSHYQTDETVGGTAQ
jgi:probable phosphoglycerate mutase